MEFKNYEEEFNIESILNSNKTENADNIYGNISGVQENLGINNGNENIFAGVGAVGNSYNAKSNLPAKVGFWSSFKGFWLQEVTAGSVKEFWTQPVRFDKVHDFLFQEIKI